MRSVTGSSDADLTARARIRDTAIALVARDGFRAATVRAVAAEAGVSPALVLHHFGAKQGLREACDDAVWSEFHRAMVDTTEDLGPGQLLSQLNREHARSPMAGYLTRAIGDGGPFADRVFAGIVEDVERWLTASVAAGQIRPTADEHTRAQMLTCFSLGSTLLGRYVLGPDTDPLQVSRLLEEKFMVTVLDLFTDGLFLSGSVRDTLLQHEKEHHDE